jgi:hypothetical protein
LQNIVDKINALLTKIFEIIKSHLIKLVPLKVKVFKANLKERIEKNKKKFIEFLIKLKEQSIVLFKKVLKDLKALKRTTSKKLRQLNSFIENFSIKKIDFKKIFLSTIAILSIPYKKLRPFIVSIPRKTYIIGISILSSLILFSAILYNPINNIYKKKTNKDLISSEKSKQKGEQQIDYIERTSYFKREKKQFTIRDIDLPIYVESVNSIKMLTLDFTIEGDNKYIAAFFKGSRNENLIKNQLIGSVHPIVPTFPLGEEGKRILKHKLKKEMNVLIKKLDIKGYISNVYINNILAN